MPYVMRKNGKVVGLYSDSCLGIAEEYLPDDNAEVLAYRNPPPSSADVNAERDRRTEAGVPFMGHVFDFNQMGKDNITGAATLAKFAILKGAQPGDYRWANPNVDFSWIVQSNEKVLMDAHQVSALGDVAANWATLHIFAARAIKDMVPIPSDYADDKYWPARS